MIDTQPLILIIEDNPMDADLLQRELSGLGLAADVARDATEALTAIGSKFYTVAFIDINLQGVMNGWDLRRQIRESAPETSVVVVTGSSTLHQAPESELLQIVVKPVTASVLQQLLIL